MIGRIVRPADFERVLATAPRSRSAHFVVHHVFGVPSRARAPSDSAVDLIVVPPVSPELSTDVEPHAVEVVDESAETGLRPLPAGHWLGLVVPKRHAKRAATRNLIKRQIRAALTQHAVSLPPGLWVVRLRVPFDRKTYVSPVSDVLRTTTWAEIEQLLNRAASGPSRGAGRSNPARTRR